MSAVKFYYAERFYSVLHKHNYRARSARALRDLIFVARMLEPNLLFHNNNGTFDNVIVRAREDSDAALHRLINSNPERSFTWNPARARRTMSRPLHAREIATERRSARLIVICFGDGVAGDKLNNFGSDWTLALR